MTATDDRLDEIEQRLAELEAENEQLQNENDQLQERVGDLEDQNDQLQERVDDLEKENNRLEQQLDQTRLEIAEIDEPVIDETLKTHIVSNITNLKDRLDGETPTPEAEEIGYSGSNIAETPLEQVVAMPDEMAEESLTPNQKRARHVAANIDQYASDTPGGRVIRSKEIRTVLSARFDVSHSQTIERVRAFLLDLGGDDVECKEKKSCKSEYQTEEKRVVFDSALVRRLDRIANDSGSNHGVVTS